MRMTWKRHRESYHPDYYELRINKERIVTVQQVRDGKHAGQFYWYGSDEERGIPSRNTAAEGKYYAILEQAKADAREYVEECLKKTREAD
jgi:hypothetical protein